MGGAIKDNTVYGLNIRIILCSNHLSFHLTIQIPMKLIQLTVYEWAMEFMYRKKINKKLILNNSFIQPSFRQDCLFSFIPFFLSFFDSFFFFFLSMYLFLTSFLPSFLPSFLLSFRVAIDTTHSHSNKRLICLFHPILL